MKEKLKIDFLKALRVAFYLCGFPLMLILIFKDSIPFINEQVFASSHLVGFWIAFGIWLVISIVQIVLHYVSKKKVVSLIATMIAILVLLLLPMQIFDASKSKYIDNLQNSITNENVTVENYKKQTQWFVTLSDKESYTENLIERVRTFENTYNLGNTYFPKVYRSITQMQTKAVDKNGNTLSDKDIEKIEKSGGYVYNPNGLLYDGYIFGVKEALDLIDEYNKFQQIKNIDDLLNQAVTNAESSNEWAKYSSSTTFAKNKANADKFALGEERINLMLNVLITNFRTVKSVTTILNTLKNSSDFEAFKPIINILTTDTLVSLDTLCGAGFSAINAMQQNPKFENILSKLADYEISDTSSPEALKKQIITLVNSIASYNHPNNKMVWQFVENTKVGKTNVDLKRYAWVKYHTQQFGRCAGVVLVATDEPLVGNKIGYDTPASKAFDSAEIEQLKTDLSYQPDMYPVFAARRYMTIFAFVIVLSMLLSFLCSKKIEKLSNPTDEKNKAIQLEDLEEKSNEEK